MPESASGKDRTRNQIGHARSIGLFMTSIAFLTAFYELEKPLWIWCTFSFYFFAWPHLAYYRYARSHFSMRVGKQHLWVDTIFCSMGVAALNFYLVPSAILMTMIALNNISTGGLKMFAWGLLVQAFGIALGTLVFGWNPIWQNSVLVTIACFPMLTTYPLAMGLFSYRFAIRNYQQKLELRKLSRTDGLTGLYNRTYWQSRAVEEFDRCERNDKQAVLIMLDIDHFKKINDNFGHDIGDEVIRRLSELLKRQLRNIDIIGRFGGEEFCIVLPDIGVNECKKIAERLRIVVANEKIESGKDTIQFTISIGFAEFTRHMQGVDEWIKAADTALYEAKNNGRNRYCIAPVHKGLTIVKEDKSKQRHSH